MNDQLNDLKNGLEVAESARDEYSSNFLNELGEAYRAIHQFGEAVEQYKEFGTENDVKSVAVSRPAADSAFQTLQDLQSRSADYVMGAAFAEDDEAAEPVIEITRLMNRYRELQMDAVDIGVEAARDYDLNMDQMSWEIAADSDQYDEELYEAPDYEEVAQMIQETAEELGIDLTE